MPAAPETDKVAVNVQPEQAIRAILTEGVLTKEKALELAIATAESEPLFDVLILQTVCDSDRKWPEGVPEFEMCRALDVIRATARNVDRLRMLLLRFLRVPRAHVRARMAGLSVLLKPNDSWFATLAADPDSRVRSNALEAIGEFPLTPSRRNLLLMAANDSNHRVRTTALYVLAKNGDEEALSTLRAIIAQGPDKMRRAAAWALVKLGRGMKRPAGSPQPAAEPATSETVSAESAPAEAAV